MVKHSRRSTRRRRGGLSRKDEDNFLASKAKERREELAKVGDNVKGSLPKVFESVGTEQRKPKTWYSADTMAARAAASGGRTRRRRHRRR